MAITEGKTWRVTKSESKHIHAQSIPESINLSVKALMRK